MGIAPGERIGRYEILEELGRGAMGEVWKARDTKMFGELRAIKVLSERLSTNDQARSRFTREVQTVAKLRHTNVVTIYDWGEHEARPYFVMEYLEGVNLSDVVGRTDDLPFRERLQIGIQMCAALEYAHAQKVIHRDIKPGNIMIIQQGRQLLVKLVDFGIAHVEASNLTHASQPGTYSYMSPEQLRNEEIDHRSDLFSLGIVLYEIFAGVHPFHAQSEPMISTRILTEGAGSMLERQEKLPSALDGLVLELLEKDPNQRPDSAEKVGESLNVIMMDWSPTEGFGTDPSTRDLDERKRRAVKGFEDDARRYEAAGSLDRALEAWKLALALAPDSRRIRGKIEALEHRLASESRLRDYLRKARESLDEGDLQAARNHYRDAWVIRPDHPDVAEFKERMAAAEKDGARSAAAPEDGPTDPVREEFVRPRLDSAQGAMDEGRLDDARSGLVEILHRYPDEMLAQVLLERCIQAQTVPGLDFRAYRASLRTAEELLAKGDSAGAREAAEQAGEIWKDDAEWKEVRQRAEDATESRGRDVLRRVEGLLRDADRLSDDPGQALGLVREAAEAVREAERLGYAPEELQAPREDIARLEQEFRRRSEKRREADESRVREIERSLALGRDRRTEGERLAAAGPAEYTRARETYRQAREAFARVLEEEPEHLEALDAIGKLDRALQELEVGIREYETASKEVKKRLAEAKELVESADALVHGEAGDLQRCLRLLDDASAHVDAARGLERDSAEARRVEEQIESLRSRARRGIKKSEDDTRKVEDGLRETTEVLAQVEKLSVAKDVAALERAVELCRRGERAAGRVLAVDPARSEAKDALERLEGLRQHFRSEIQRREDDERRSRTRAAEISGLLDRAERLVADPSPDATADARAVLDEAAALAEREDIDPGGELTSRIRRIGKALDERLRAARAPREEPPKKTREDRGEPIEERLDRDLESARSAFRKAKKAQSRRGASPQEIRSFLTEARDRLAAVLAVDPAHDEANRATEKVERWLGRLDRETAGDEVRPEDKKPIQREAAPKPPEVGPRRTGLWIGVGAAAVVVVAIVLAVVLRGGGPDEPTPAVARATGERSESTPDALPETRAPVLAEGDQDGNDADEQAETPLGRDREAAGDTGEPAGAGPEVRTPPEQPAAAAPDREPARSASTPDREPARSASTADRPVRQSPPPPVREPAARAPTVPAWQSDYDALARDLGRSRPEPSAYGSNDALEAALNETGELLARIDDLQADHPRADALVEKLAPERSRLQRREGALRDRLEELRAPAAPEVWTGFYGTACDPETNAAVEGLRIVAISRTGRRSQPTATETGGAYRLPVPEDLGWSRILVTNAGGAESTFSLGGVRMTAGSHREKNLCGQ